MIALWKPAPEQTGQNASIEDLADGIARFTLNMLRARLMSFSVSRPPSSDPPGPTNWHAAEILRREA